MIVSVNCLNSAKINGQEILSTCKGTCTRFLKFDGFANTNKADKSAVNKLILKLSNRCVYLKRV